MAFDCTMGLNEEDKVWEDMRMESDTGFFGSGCNLLVIKIPLIKSSDFPM